MRLRLGSFVVCFVAGCNVPPAPPVTAIPVQPLPASTAAAPQPPVSPASSSASASSGRPGLGPCTQGTEVYLTLHPIENRSARATADVEQSLRLILGREAAKRAGTAIAGEHVAGRCEVEVAFVVESLDVTAQQVVGRTKLTAIDRESRKVMTTMSQTRIVPVDPKRGPDQGGAVLDELLGGHARGLVRVLRREIDHEPTAEVIEDLF